MGSHVSPMSDSFKLKRLRRGGNYREWSAYVRALLVEASLDTYLDTEADASVPEAVRRQTRCKAKLLLTVEGPLMRVVEEADTAKAAWDALKQDHNGSLKTRRPLLLGELRDLKQGQNETVQSYADRAWELLSKLVDVELRETETLLGDAFLQGLKPALRFCVPMLTPKVDEGFETVVLELKDHTRLMQEVISRSDRDSGQVNAARSGEEQQRDGKETRVCHYCKKPGHLKRNCWKKKLSLILI